MHSTAARKAARSTPACHTGGHIASYRDTRGREREIITVSGVHGSTLVIDRIAGTHGDKRLLAHLCADEPPENARIVCALYLAAGNGRYCRALAAEDLAVAPLASNANSELQTGAAALVDASGVAYGLGRTGSGRSVSQIRWQRRPADRETCRVEAVTVRDVVAAFELYEPIRSLTIRAIAAREHDRNVSVTALRAELRRVCESPIVLNRGLREAVLVAIENGLSMSEIAIRCGRRKCDCNGAESGETSWLARRIGTLPEGGHSVPTPWVHTDVLALIARAGLGLAPREVEVQ